MTLEKVPQDRHVFEERYAGFCRLFGLANQPANDHGAAVLDDGARLRFAHRDHGRVQRGLYGLLREGTDFLQQAERDVAIVVDRRNDRQLRPHIAKLDYAIDDHVETGARGLAERDLTADQDSCLFIIERENPGRR